MAQAPTGICPHCERRRGPVGEACPGEDCLPRGYRFIPEAWLETAKEFAHRKGRTLDPLLGRMLDRYLLAGKLGEGGMGAVYLAFQQPLNREVALKVISGLELTGTTRARFEREARAISVLDHPNIVKLYDYGIAQLEFEVPYMALEYVRHGRTLRRSLADIRQASGGRIPGQTVLAIFEQVLNALAAAHEIGLVHRDMKPDNVMITRVAGNPTFVKVLDFGLAKAVQEVSGFGGDVSHTGQTLGTPHYMAPEQVQRRGGPKVDARTDLYAVAVMLFEVFTGMRPFEGETPIEVMIRKTQKEHWPMDLPAARALSRPMRDFLARGMQTRMEDRFQDAGEMLEALRNALSDRRMTAVGLDWQRHSSSEDRPATPPSPDGAPPDEDHVPTRAIAEAGVGPGEMVETVSPPAGRPWPRAWLRIAAPLLAAVIVGGGYWVVRGARAPSPAPAPQTVETPPAQVPEPAAPPAPPPAEPAPVEAVAPPPLAPPVRTLGLEVRTRPEGAEVRVDGRVIGVSPARYEFEAKDDADLDRLVEVSVALKGHREASKAVRLRDAVGAGGVDLVMERLPRPRPTPPPPPPRRRKLL